MVQSNCTIKRFMRSTFFASSPAFCVVTSSYFSHSRRCIMILIWFLFAFLWTSFEVSICNLYVLFIEMSLHFLLIFSLNCLFSTVFIVVRVHFICYILTAFWIRGLKIFLMVCNLSFHLPIRLFHRENVSNFDAVQFFFILWIITKWMVRNILWL